MITNDEKQRFASSFIIVIIRITGSDSGVNQLRNVSAGANEIAMHIMKHRMEWSASHHPA